MKKHSLIIRNCRVALTLAAMGALLLAAGGSSCTKDEDVDVVVTADITGPILAQGSENTYEGVSAFALSDSIDLERIIDDNDLDTIKSLKLESVFYRVLTPDAEPTRTVSDNLFTVRGSSGPEQNLFLISSVLVDDPAFVNWTSAPLEQAGVGIINTALDELRTGGHPELTFHVSGTSTPAGVPTNFWWEVMVRVQVVGTRSITVPDI
jgi:hypothetical protein